MNITFTKWYMDGADAQGNAFIAYHARVRIGELSIAWHAVTDYPAAGPARHEWSLARVAPPSLSRGRLIWRSSPLRSAFEFDTSGMPHEVTLLQAPAGAIDWLGAVQSARVTSVRTGTPPLFGTGYAECLTTTLPPWKIPIDRLLWGRWVADDLAGASTWFRWDGPHPLTLVVEDGIDERNATITPDSITTPQHALALGRGRMLEHRSLREIIEPIPGVASLVPESFLALEETKWLVRAKRRARDGLVHDGWALHEMVRFR